MTSVNKIIIIIMALVYPASSLLKKKYTVDEMFQTIKDAIYNIKNISTESNILCAQFPTWKISQWQKKLYTPHPST